MTKFKDLALTCGAWYQVYDNKNFMVDKNFDVVKFAELIVRECGIVADKWVDDEDNGKNLISDKLKQHFEVKE